MLTGLFMHPPPVHTGHEHQPGLGHPPQVSTLDTNHWTFTQSTEQGAFFTSLQSDIIFVKTFTLADFWPIIFYSKARNSRDIKFCDKTA